MTCHHILPARTAPSHRTIPWIPPLFPRHPPNSTRPCAPVSLCTQIIMTVASRSAQLQFPPGTPAAYEALARDCLAYDVEKRPAMAEVCARLQAMQEEYSG